MSYIVVLHVQQINVLVSLFIETYRKNQEFFFLVDEVHIDGNIIEIFKLFDLNQRHRKFNVFQI